MKRLVILAVVLSVTTALVGCKPKESQIETQDNNAAANIALPPAGPVVDPLPPVNPPVTPNVGPTVTANPDGSRNYTVQKGDTLYKIAREQLGGNTRVKDIKAANPEVSNWDVLKVGQVIKLPAK